MAGLQAITDDEFDLVRKVAKDHFGIALSDAKKALVVGRLQGLLRSRGIGTFQRYYDTVLSKPSRDDLSEFIDRISTNHTFFYREPAHFEYLAQTVLPELTRRLRASGELDLRVWCAASSTGEEPYMLAMLLREHLGVDYGRWSAGLLATDISSRALEIAREGIYDEASVKGMPPALRQRYFKSAGPGVVEVSPELRKEVVFRRFNLMNEQLPFRRPFHVVFCRNVMIYFDKETRAALVSRIYSHTAPGGHLFIGHSEALDRETTRFRWVRSAVYRREA